MTRRLLLLAALLALPVSAAATPVTLTDVRIYQDEGFTFQSLVTHPGAVVGPTSPGGYTSALDFAFRLEGAGPVTLDVSWSLAQLAASISRTFTVAAGVPLEDWEVFDPGVFDAPGVDGLVTVRLTSGGTTSTSSSDFHFIHPAPEPGTILLVVGAGLVALGRYVRRRYTR